MPIVGALEFQRKFGEYQHQAQREPVEITRHGRRELVLMSADHYDWLKAAAQRTHRTVDAADVVIGAVERAEMDPAHAKLDELLPITHTPPAADTVGIDIPLKVKQAIGLDDAPSWVIVSEHNVDEWPNGGLSPVPGKAGSFAYGFIPPGLFAKIKASFLELARQKKSNAVRR